MGTKLLDDHCRILQAIEKKAWDKLHSLNTKSFSSISLQMEEMIKVGELAKAWMDLGKHNSTILSIDTDN